MASGRLRLEQILELPEGRRRHRDGPQGLGVCKQPQHQGLELFNGGRPENIGPLSQVAVFPPGQDHQTPPVAARRLSPRRSDGWGSVLMSIESIEHRGVLK